jgi:glutaredoxin
MSRTQVPKADAEVEIIAYAPTEFFHCMHCEMVWGALDGFDWHAEQRESSLPPDLQKEYDAIGQWVTEAGQQYGDRVHFRLVDAASIQGFIKSIRHGSRKFPVFVIDGSERLSGFQREELDKVLARHLGKGGGETTND